MCSGRLVVHQKKHCLTGKQWHPKVHDLRPHASGLQPAALAARSGAQAQKSLCGAAIAVETVLVGPDKKCLNRGGRGDALG
jgi:hypothetical protein